MPSTPRVFISILPFLTFTLEITSTKQSASQPFFDNSASMSVIFLLSFSLPFSTMYFSIEPDSTIAESQSAIFIQLRSLPLFNVEATLRHTISIEIPKKNVISITKKRFGLLRISFTAMKNTGRTGFLPRLIKPFFLYRSPVVPFRIASIGVNFLTFRVLI